MRLTKKAIVVGVAGAAVALSLGGVAIAYWSSNGSGSGTATTSNGDSNLVITQTAAPTNLAPGVAAGPITFDLTNNAPNKAYVNTVTVSIASVTGPNISPTATCDASDYSLSDAVVTVQSDVASNATLHLSGPSLAFNDKASNQDGCKGATVNLAYSSN